MYSNSNVYATQAPHWRACLTCQRAPLVLSAPQSTPVLAVHVNCTIATSSNRAHARLLKTHHYFGPRFVLFAASCQREADQFATACSADRAGEAQWSVTAIGQHTDPRNMMGVSRRVGPTPGEYVTLRCGTLRSANR